MESRQTTVRLRLWLEDEGIFFGMGRVLLLDLIEEHGSLKDAASVLGMSYRAAWGKLKATEEALGTKLVETCGSKRNGCKLTEEGRLVREKYRQWFEHVEQYAIAHAKDMFPWEVKGYEEAKKGQTTQAARQLHVVSGLVCVK